MARMILAGTPPQVVEGKDLNELIVSLIEHVNRQRKKVFKFRTNHGVGDAFEVDAPLVGRRSEELDSDRSHRLIVDQINAGAVPTF